MKINKNKVNMFHKTNRVTKSNLTNKEKHIEIMDKMAIKLRGIKIKNRLMISFAVVLITQIIVIAFFSIYFSGGLIKSKVSDFSSQEMSLISKNIQSSLDNYKSDILSITMGKEFQDSFSNYSTVDELSKATFVNTLKESTIKKYIMDENVSSVVLVDIAGKFIGGKGYNSVFADKILNLKDNKGGTIYLSIVNISEDPTKPSYGINLFREIKSTTSGSTIGYIWVNLKEDILYSIYKDNIKGNDTSLMILDSKGTVISSKNKEDINKVYSNKTLIEKVLNSTKSTTLNIDNKGYLVSSSIIDGYGWKLVNTVATSYLNKEASIIKYSIIGIAIIEFLLAILVAYMISTSISNPLDTIMHSIQMAKEGKIKAGKNDLNDDEVGEVSRNFNEMMDNLSSLIGSTKDSSSKISNSIQSIVEVSEQSYAASEEIAATMNEVATGAGSQAEGMSTTISNLNKLSDAIDQVEISLKDTLQVIYNTKGMGEDTKTAITFLKEKSRDTKGVSVKISDNISELSTYMKEIGSITKLIVGISEQTNLLALNASIEAARVGDVGRGFTIVAEQVKKLAIQSKDASTKIDKIMGELTKKIVFITQSASKTQSIIAKQDEAIEETDSTALSIITSMEGVGENITELIGFIKEIHVLKGETVSSIEGINAVSEETAAITEEVTATTQEQILDMENLSGAATSLNEMIKKLNTTMSMFEV